MRELYFTVEDEKLREMGRHPKLAIDKGNDIDVSDKVMKRVYEISDRRRRLRRSQRSQRKVLPRTAVIAIASFTIIGASVTVYAASQYLEFHNSQGVAYVKTMAPKEYSESEKQVSALLEPYNQQVLDRIQPGEYALYYINDTTINSADPHSIVREAYKPISCTTLSELKQEIQRTEAPLLTQPVYLPEGYQFNSGKIWPSINSLPSATIDQQKSEFENELTSQPTLVTGEDKLLIKKFQWTKGGVVSLQFTKGDDDININMMTLKSDDTTTISQYDDEAAEKLNINGQEAYYLKSSDTLQNQYHSSNTLGWRDEKNNISIQIWDNQGSQLNKDDLINIAESLILTH